ncbi:hypothetical protein [Paraburkholderia caribensis]|uniref:hypothetical protein n=1 Tax=Paraburkholderia caribensis TaxID=75105 RepID=UPI001D067B33|nr:hypothetical protein [Paraburkholderia caribensis]
MLENLDPNMLRQRLGFETDSAGAPAVGSVAAAARACIQSWRSPARARVTTYLHRQFLAAGFEEEQPRDYVKDVIDALIDIGDVTRVRLDAKDSLLLSSPSVVSISDEAFIVLGRVDDHLLAGSSSSLYARHTSSLPVAIKATSFSEWIGSADFHSHLARRVGSQTGGTIREFWHCLTDALTHDGNPLDSMKLRAVVGSPTPTGLFGRHNAPGVTGRWASTVPDGTWCGVRPGRSPNEWHPVLAKVEGTATTTVDLYNWDEWAWALLARGIVTGMPEYSNWRNGILAFEHPVPTQFVRAMRLLGGPGERPWTWQVSEAAYLCFEKWRGEQI